MHPSTHNRVRLLAMLVSAAALWAAMAVPPPDAAGLGDLAGQIKVPQPADKAAQPADADKEAKEARSGPPAYTGPRKRVSVMEVEVKITSTSTEPTTSGGVVTTTTVSIPPPTDFGQGLTEMLTTALVASGRFVVLERKALADIQTEQNLAASGAVNPAAAAPSGKLLGAQALVRGAVTEYTYRRTSTAGSASFLKGIGVGTSQAEAAVVLDVRLYSVTTGQILDSVKAEGRAKSSATAVDVDKEDIKMSASGFSQTPLGHATRQAIERAVAFIVKRMEKVPWEGRVAAVDADETGAVTTAYINAGSRAGLKVGDKFEVLRPGRTIVDPETQVVIGRARDTRLGTCRIESLTKTLSVAVPLEGGAFQVADVVRYIPPKPPVPPPAEGAATSQPEAVQPQPDTAPQPESAPQPEDEQPAQP